MFKSKQINGIISFLFSIMMGGLHVDSKGSPICLKLKRFNKGWPTRLEGEAIRIDLASLLKLKGESYQSLIVGMISALNEPPVARY